MAQLTDVSHNQYLLNIRRSGSGPTIVLIHGVAGSGAIWNKVSKQLEKDFDVVLIDLLGYGYSPKPNVTYSAKTHVQAIHFSLKQRNVQPPYILTGLSMGVLLCMQYAAEYPDEVDKIISVGLPFYDSAEAARSKLKQSFWSNALIHHPLLSRLTMPLLFNIFRRSQFLSNLAAPVMYKGQVAHETLMTTHRAFASTTIDCLVAFRIESVLGKTKVPILFLHGGNDQWTPVEDVYMVADKLSKASVKVVPNQLHNLVVLAPAQVADSIKTFVDSR